MSPFWGDNIGGGLGHEFKKEPPEISKCSSGLSTKDIEPKSTPSEKLWNSRCVVAGSVSNRLQLAVGIMASPLVAFSPFPSFWFW